VKRRFRQSDEPSRRRPWRRGAIWAAAASAPFLLASLVPTAAAQTPETAGAFWPTLDLHAQLASNIRLLAFGESKKDQDVPYQQADFGAAIGYQWKRLAGLHPFNIDPDREHFLVTGLGYEHLRTFEPGSDSVENRLLFSTTPRAKPLGPLLLEDRNRIEFRWVDGDYSTRYRNRLTASADLETGGFRFSPYASAEFFYDITDGAWKQQQYAAGLQVPWRSLLRVDLYYLRQKCGSCSPEHLNVFGLTLGFFVGGS
jgi:hypothetical protein